MRMLQKKPTRVMKYFNHKSIQYAACHTYYDAGLITLTNGPGCLFVRLYYSYFPTAADFIGDHEGLQIVAAARNGD